MMKMDIYTVSFFGHRDFGALKSCENKLTNILKDLIREKYYVDFLVGRNGGFDQFVSSTIKTVKKEYCSNNSSLTLVLPYYTAEYKNNEASFLNYYDEVEICQRSSVAHFKAAIGLRNCDMVDRSDLIICYIDRNYGGAYKAVNYAQKVGKNVINLALMEETEEDAE